MRGYADGVFESDDRPPLRMRVVPELRYLGSFLFDLKQVARVERHVFVETENALVRRMLVLQFEGFLPNVDEMYRYALTDPREHQRQFLPRSQHSGRPNHQFRGLPRKYLITR